MSTMSRFQQTVTVTTGITTRSEVTTDESQTIGESTQVTDVITTIVNTVATTTNDIDDDTRETGYIIPVTVVLVAFTVGVLTAILCILMCRRCRNTPQTICSDVITQRSKTDDDRQQLTRVGSRLGNSQSNPYMEPDYKNSTGEYTDMHSKLA